MKFNAGWQPLPINQQTHIFVRMLLTATATSQLTAHTDESAPSSFTQSLTTQPPRRTRKSHPSDRRDRECLADLCNSTTTTTPAPLYPWRQVEEAQAARYRNICREFDDNIRHVIQGNHQAAFLAADAGFIIAQELYYDVLNTADRFLSDTASDGLLDLVRFCFGHAFRVRNTNWSQGLNSVGWIWVPRNTDGPQSNWMVKRGLNLVTDLLGMLDLFNHPSPRLRGFMVKALNFVAEFSFAEMQRCLIYEHLSPEDVNNTIMWFWAMRYVFSLNALRLQIHHADPFVRDAALDAQFDMNLSNRWTRVTIRQAHQAQ